jgi:hypothetical protein
MGRRTRTDRLVVYQSASNQPAPVGATSSDASSLPEAHDVSSTPGATSNEEEIDDGDTQMDIGEGFPSDDNNSDNYDGGDHESEGITAFDDEIEDEDELELLYDHVSIRLSFGDLI